MEPTDAPHVDEQTLREIAHSLDCHTEEEIAALGKLKLSTLHAWRQRGKGPPYILFGNAFLYPRAATAAHLQTLVRDRDRGVTAKALL